MACPAHLLSEKMARDDQGQWICGVRAMKERDGGYFQVSLMNVFRQAAQKHDAREKDVAVTEEGRVLSSRTIERRDGASQSTLREHLSQDLANLMGTIHLEAAVDLTGLDWVKKSILNYGMQDMNCYSTDHFRDPAVIKGLRAALLAHEPRLVPQSLIIRLRTDNAGADQRIAFDIRAEMSARPVDVPLEFVAEIKSGGGKVALSNLVVRG